MHQLHKRYGDTVALDGIDLEVRAGEVLGLLGPNGAGKTTAVEIFEGLRRADSGTVRVLGLDPGDPELRQQVGVRLQRSQLPEKMRVGEAVELYAGFYRDPRPVDGLAAQPATNREAARQLFVSGATVKTHLLHVYAELGVNDRAAAVAEGFQRGLLIPDRREDFAAPNPGPPIDGPGFRRVGGGFRDRGG